MSCKVSRLLLLTKRFKSFQSLFVKLLFLPLRVKVSTVPVLPYLLRTLVIVCGQVSTFFDSWELKINSQKQNEKTRPFFSDVTLNLMSNDWINEVPKKKNSSSFFFSCSWSDVCLFLFLLFFSALALLSKRAPCIKFSCWQCAQQGWKFRASFLKVTNTYVPRLYRASSRMIQEELFNEWQAEL